MKYHQKLLCVLAVLLPGTCFATIHVSLEEIQARMFPNQKMMLTSVVVSDAVREKMQDISSVRQSFKADRIYHAEKGGWLVVDEVVGKHEMIKYAVGINADGSVKQIEVMDYVESYGYEVAESKWRQQFVGKTSADPIKLKKDIDGISGATLSAKHLSDGVKRVMVMYDLVLKTIK